MHFPGQEHLPANKNTTPKPAPPAGGSGVSQQQPTANSVNRRATAVNLAKDFLTSRGIPPKTDELLDLAADIDDFLQGPKAVVNPTGSKAA